MEIKIACTGATTIPIEKLIDFQGELKELSNQDYLRLREQIVSQGFSEPVSVWLHDGHHYILNGHQRVKTVKRLIEDEGATIGPIPVSLIEAKNKNQAKRKLLALTSQFGKIQKQGLYEFLADTNIQIDELFTNFRFPEIDLPSFTEEFFVDRASASDPLGDDELHSPDGQAPGALSSSPPSMVYGGNPDGQQADPMDSVGYVKTVQLMFEESKLSRFDAMTTALKKATGINNNSDLIWDLLERAYNELQESGGAN